MLAPSEPDGGAQRIAPARRGRCWWLSAVGSGLAVVGLTAALCMSSGCASVAYLAQSAQGHVRLLGAARPVDEWLAAPGVPEGLKQRLAQSQAIRRFAVTELALPDNRSYTRYADLGRPAAVWNVVATPELSLALRTWCFPVVGCVAYRGYYSPEAAELAAKALAAEELEVSVYPVPAYSTLGWADVLGGDPLLNTFVGWPEHELARMVFHELSHQVVYVAGDTVFNESYATAVERLGLGRWLRHRGDAAQIAQAAALERRRSEFRALTGRYREALRVLFAGPESDELKRQRKQALMAELRAEYAALKAGPWAGYTGYDQQIAQANNASLALQAAYHQWVPAFEALFLAESADFSRFHRAVAALAALPRAEREAALGRLMASAAPHDSLK